MSKFVVGAVFNNYTVEGVASIGRYLCRCSVCGNQSEVFYSVLIKQGGTKYCTHCKNTEGETVKHGMWKTPEFTAWSHMLRRCNSSTHPQYLYYGGRGIKVCDSWQAAFENFYKDMGPRPSDKHSLDRIDVNGNYEPGNCRWATVIQQNRNKVNTKYLTLKGDRLQINEWAKKLGINISTLWVRVRKGWTDEQILTTPVAKRSPQGLR